MTQLFAGWVLKWYLVDRLSFSVVQRHENFCHRWNVFGRIRTHPRNNRPHKRWEMMKNKSGLVHQANAIDRNWVYETSASKNVIFSLSFTLLLSLRSYLQMCKTLVGLAFNSGELLHLEGVYCIICILFVYGSTIRKRWTKIYVYEFEIVS